jgi:D-alanine-D-alanine ligase
MELDVIFPVLHGPYGEDGTVQGLFELANVPYVGAGVLASAAGMDKAVAKVLFAARGLRVADHLVVTPRGPRRRTGPGGAPRRGPLAYPVFVKPANLGSSVGISKARDRASLEAALALARSSIGSSSSRWPCPTPGRSSARCSATTRPRPRYRARSCPRGSSTTTRRSTSTRARPCSCPPGSTRRRPHEVRRVSIEAFRAVDGAGMARVDFLLDAASNTLYFNEVNTIPGFTTISMYPKLWEASGLPYTALLDRLVALALERHGRKQRLRTSYP